MEEQIKQNKLLVKILTIAIITLCLDFFIKIYSNTLFQSVDIIVLGFSFFILFPLEIGFLIGGFLRGIYFYIKTKNNKLILFIILFGVILVGRVLYSFYSF